MGRRGSAALAPGLGEEGESQWVREGIDTQQVNEAQPIDNRAHNSVTDVMVSITELCAQLLTH